MAIILNLIGRLDLQLFAEAAGGGDAGSGGVTGVTGSAAVTHGRNNNPLADVQYGKQETAPIAEVQTDVASTEDRNAKFEELIKGEYKDLFDGKVQNIVQKRLKNSTETVEKYNELAPTLEMLSKKYGVDASDIKALNKAILEDDSYYEEEALERGISVEQLKYTRKLERDNAELNAQMKARQSREQADKLYSAWMDQASQAKSVYPSFNLESEMKNPQFVQLLRSNVDVRTAYEVIHKDEILPAAMQFTAKTVEQKIANSIAAGGRRPTENGMSSQSAAVVKNDVTQLTKADREEIARRVARGERIVF